VDINLPYFIDSLGDSYVDYTGRVASHDPRATLLSTSTDDVQNRKQTHRKV